VEIVDTKPEPKSPKHVYGQILAHRIAIKGLLAAMTVFTGKDCIVPVIKEEFDKGKRLSDNVRAGVAFELARLTIEIEAEQTSKV
jgi:hypothetical protein